MENNKITEGSITKQLMLFYLPILIGTFFQQLYNTVDAAIVGHYLGKQCLSAVGGTTMTIVNLLLGFFVGLASGAGVIISQYFGAGDSERTKKSIHTAVAIGIIAGILLTVLGLIFSPYLLEMTNTPDEIMTHAVLYLRIYFGGVIFVTLYNMGSGILRALGDSRRPLYFLFISSGVNIVLDLLFIRTFKMGVDGAAFATVISQAVSVFLVFMSLRRLNSSISFEFKKIRLDSHIFLLMLKIGIPAGIQSMLYSISNIVIQKGINSFGTDTIAAWTAFGKVDAIFWMAINSFGVAVTTFVGQNYGAGRMDRVRKCVRRSLIIAATIATVMSVVIVFFGRYFLLLFTDDPAVLDIGHTMIMYIVPTFITYICVEVFAGAARGVGKTVVPLVISLVGICALRVVWINVIAEVNNTLFNLCLSYPVSWIVTSLCFIVYYLFGNFSKKKLKTE